MKPEICQFEPNNQSIFKTFNDIPYNDSETLYSKISKTGSKNIESAGSIPPSEFDDGKIHKFSFF